MVLPLKTALIGRDSGETIGEERLILLDQPESSISFFGIDEPPLLSINRDFSAPILLEAERKPGELERLAEVDPNPFARYEACQELMYRALIEAPVAARRIRRRSSPRCAARSVPTLDPAFKGEALSLPSEGLIGDRMELVDPDAIHRSRETLRRAAGAELASELAQAQAAGAAGDDLSPSAKGIRKLKTVALWLLAGGDPARGAALAKAQYDAADNMTDRQGALSVLTSLDAPEREAAFADFYQRYRDDGLVLDKWFALQAAAQRPTRSTWSRSWRAMPTSPSRIPTAGARW